MKNAISLFLLLCVITLGCTEATDHKQNLAKITALQASIDSLTNAQQSMKPIATFLTFQDNNSENAMNFYLDIFENSKVIKIQRWGKEGPGKEGTIMHSIFELNGNRFMCSDSPPIHDWDFSPAFSNYIDCEDENEIDKLFAQLSVNGNVTMPLNNYGFSQKFGWVIDQFGISWQLNLK